jgi:aminocarboxymuconate-semialdehyde decarboxylase
MYRIVLSGAFDRSPVSVIAHHCGAMLPFFEARVARGFQTAGMRSRDTDYVDRIKALKRPPMAYFRDCFYGDTALSGGSIGLKCGLEFFGPEHVLFASDAPFNDVRAPLEAFQSLKLDAKTNEAIYVRNAERLLRRTLA